LEVSSQLVMACIAAMKEGGGTAGLPHRYQYSMLTTQHIYYYNRMVVVLQACHTDINTAYLIQKLHKHQNSYERLQQAHSKRYVSRSPTCEQAHSKRYVSRSPTCAFKLCS
jgi:hypothetical protein